MHIDNQTGLADALASGAYIKAFQDRPQSRDRRERCIPIALGFALAAIVCLFIALYSCEVISVASEGTVQRGVDDLACMEAAHAKTAIPGGVSAGMQYCIRKWAAKVSYYDTFLAAVDNASVALDAGVSVEAVESSIEWSAQISRGADPWWAFSSTPYTFNAAAWVLPPNYAAEEAEARMLFVHGGNAGWSALGPDYLGLVANLANWTGLPVLAANFGTEPIVPWPQNVRNILHFVELALKSGPRGDSRRAGKLFVFSDSEGSLSLMQTVMTLFDPALRAQSGYGELLRDPASWMGGVILSSPVLDVSCATPSMEWNCFNETANTGDPDVGMCDGFSTMSEKVASCRATYLPYFYGLQGTVGVSDNAEANRRWLERRDFFEQPSVAPLRADLKGLPPFLILSGERDFYVSDATALAARLCMAGVAVDVYTAVGGFHDFMEYSQGCGGPTPMLEGVEALRRAASFVAA